MNWQDEHFQGCAALRKRGWNCTCGGVTPEYYEQKLKDCRASHEHASSMLKEAENERNKRNSTRIAEWQQERLRLTGIYMETQRRLKEARLKEAMAR